LISRSRSLTSVSHSHQRSINPSVQATSYVTIGTAGRYIRYTEKGRVRCCMAPDHLPDHCTKRNGPPTSRQCTPVTPFTRYNRWSNRLLGQLYNRLFNQLDGQPVGQPVASCKQTLNRLSNRLFNRFDKRLYRVNGGYNNFILLSRVSILRRRGLLLQTVKSGHCSVCRLVGLS